MHRVSTASTSDREETVDFLERRGMLENIWLLRFAQDAFRLPEIYQVLLCRVNEELTGVALISDLSNLRPLSTGKRPYDYEAWMDCVDRDAVQSLVEALPPARTGRFVLMRPVLHEYFNDLPGVGRGRTDYYFTVSPERFRPVEGEEVIELTPADGALFEGTERAARRNPLHNLKGDTRMFAILRKGRAATSAATRLLTRSANTGHGVRTIDTVITESCCRNLGLGKRLVSHMTKLILAEGHAPTYWTDPDNFASQALAKALGYWQYASEITYLWRKP